MEKSKNITSEYLMELFVDYGEDFHTLFCEQNTDTHDIYLALCKDYLIYYKSTQALIELYVSEILTHLSKSCDILDINSSNDKNIELFNDFVNKSNKYFPYKDHLLSFIDYGRIDIDVSERNFVTEFKFDEFVRKYYVKKN